MPKTRTTRRTFLKGSIAASAFGATAGGALWRPRRAVAALPRERKFLFFFAGGGWDTTTVHDPKFGDDAGAVDMDAGTFLGEQGALRWTAGADRPAVSRYFERWGWRSSIINGIDAHCVGHGAATRSMLTGSVVSSLSDWPTLLASQTKVAFSMPHVVFGGPSFAGIRGASLVRGGDVSLLDLNGREADQMDGLAACPVDAPVHSRPDRFVLSKDGLVRPRGGEGFGSLQRATKPAGHESEARPGGETLGLLDQAVRAIDLMRRGLSRCAMLRIPGSYDTHENNVSQAPQQDAFYDTLDRLMLCMSMTPGHTSPSLLDEVVVVAMSDLGRTPRLNGVGGKDHWPIGSMMVAGPGVRGGRVIGATDQGLVGVPINHASGRPSTSGDVLGCESVGAALLTIGGVDANSFLQGVQPLGALIG